MLKELSLHHFVIAKSCSIVFAPGFNVLSGETGTGKTMLIQALGLVLGQKADVKLIRKGEEKAVIRALFDIQIPYVYDLLRQGGIEIEPEEDLLIQREINLSGKNRILINSQQAALPLLKAIAPFLIEVVSQHSQLMLKEGALQREFLDEYGDLFHERESYKDVYLKEKELEQDFETAKEKYRLGQMHHLSWKESLDEITKTHIEENEEELLFQEYKTLSHLQDILKLGGRVFAELSEDSSSLLDNLSRLRKELDKLTSFDTKVEGISQLMGNSYDLLSEASFQLSRYLSHLESEPDRLHHIESKLTLLKLLKRKYGSSFEEIETYKNTLINNLKEFHSLEASLHTLAQEKECLKTEREKRGASLTKERELHAKKLSHELTHHLQELNMNSAKLVVYRKETSPTPFGCDEISFHLAANMGESLYPIKDHASGGELSRILFALKLLLANKDSRALIFDEIDANIGGVTASILGKKLKTLGESRQVICITHFPQVAIFADHHMQMIKSSIDGRITTEIKTLSESARKEELLRMLGGTQELFHPRENF